MYKKLFISNDPCIPYQDQISKRLSFNAVQNPSAKDTGLSKVGKGLVDR